MALKAPATEESLELDLLLHLFEKFRGISMRQKAQPTWMGAGLEADPGGQKLSEKDKGTLKCLVWGGG